MQLLNGFTQKNAYQHGVMAIGNFDGVHRGHQRIISTAVQHAQAKKVPAVVMTFDPHPLELLRPDVAPPRLSTPQSKLQHIENLGVDCTILFPTNKEFLQLSPQEFFAQIVQSEVEATGIVEGPNFCFGKNRAGDVLLLQEYCTAANLTLEIVDSVELENLTVSSSEVRSQLTAGNVRLASELLGHRYAIAGRVVKGAGRGRELGFPTANIVDVETLLPADGVYAGEVTSTSTRQPAAVHLGPNPTFGEDQRKLEVHLIDFEGDLYDQQMELEFVERIRETSTFDSQVALIQQLQQDIATARRLASF